MHFYNDFVEKFHVFTYKTEYIKFLNSSNFFLTELDEVKSCINCVETANSGIEL